MAINAYCGVMGSGKSYEVVSGPLLDAVASGRRVVANIDGLDEDKIHAYLAEKRGLDVATLGRVVKFTTERVLEPGFFPVENESKDGATVTPGLVEAGDFVVVDEAWKLWRQGEKVPAEHVAFFRMHRHFVHDETGLACDVVIMVQDIADLPRLLKAVVELSFRMVKLKSVGMPSRYRVEMYEGWKQNRKTLTGQFQKGYSKEIFPLYKSYAGKAGKEAIVDKRQNVFSNRRLWVMAVLGLVSILFLVRFLNGFFHPKAKVQRPAIASVAGSSSASGAVASSGVAEAAVRSSTQSFSDTWRIAGSFASDGVMWVLLTDSSGRFRVESPSQFQNRGIARVGTVDGDRVSTFSGARPSTGALVSSSGGPALGVPK